MIANLTITGIIKNAFNPNPEKPQLVMFDLFISDNEKDVIKVTYWSKKDNPVTPDKMENVQVLLQGNIFDHNGYPEMKADLMVSCKSTANNIILMSAVSRPELKTVRDKSIFNFSMRSQSYDSVNKENKTSWFKVAAWEKTADNLSRFIHDKHYVIVNGTFSLKRWTNKENEEKTDLSVTVNTFTLMPKSLQPQGLSEAVSSLTESIDFSSTTTSFDTEAIAF